MSSKEVRVGIVGTGNIAYVHEAGYTESSDLAQIVAVCDVNEAVARDRAPPYGARVYSDYRALVAEAEMDMVDVTVPHRWHDEIAMSALQPRLHHPARAACSVHQTVLAVGCGQLPLSKQHQLRVGGAANKVDHYHHHRDITQHGMMQHIAQPLGNIVPDALLLGLFDDIEAGRGNRQFAGRVKNRA